MVQIEDGKGTGNRVQVNKENQLVVNAVTQSELEHESEENGQSYNWSSDVVDVAASGTLLLVKNTSDSHLHIKSIDIANGALASQYITHLPTIEVTPAGTTITATNLNTASSNVADADAKSNETNNSLGNVLDVVFLAVDTNHTIDTDGLILAKNKSIAIDVTENTVESAVTIIGHYEV